MPGIPPNLDLSFLRGEEVIQVCLGKWEVQVHFVPSAYISIEGDWELATETGEVIDRSSDALREQPFHLNLLLGRIVVAVEVDPPLSFALRFTGGLVLRMFANASGYESFTIEPGTIIV